MTFCELREKDVINIRDCKRLGHGGDLIIHSEKRLYSCPDHLRKR